MKAQGNVGLSKAHMAAKAIQADCDVKATNIILQALPQEIYALFVSQGSSSSNLLISYPMNDTPSTVNHNAYMASTPQIDYAPIAHHPSKLSSPETGLMLRTSSNPRQQATINDGRVTIQPIQGRQNHMSAGSSRPFTSGSGGTSGRQKVIVCYNCKGEGHMAKQCTKPKRKRDAEWFKDKVGYDGDWIIRDGKVTVIVVVVVVAEGDVKSRDLSSLSLEEIISHLKVHEMIMEKDFRLVRGKREKLKYLALKAKNKSSDDETLISKSKDEEYAMAVIDLKKFSLGEDAGSLGNHVMRRNHAKNNGMIRKEKVYENDLDVHIQITSSDNVQNYLDTRSKEHFWRFLER
nr:alpha/beta hydrolases superfamily protein [Tanacetum cinerariifolium]